MASFINGCVLTASRLPISIGLNQDMLIISHSGLRAPANCEHFDQRALVCTTKVFLIDLGMQSQGDVLEIGPRYRENSPLISAEAI